MITARQLRRLETAIEAQIREYARCRSLLRHVDQDVLKLGIEVFRSEAAFALWLCAPARALNGKAPLRVLRSAKGRSRVTNILRAIDNAVYL